MIKKYLKIMLVLFLLLLAFLLFTIAYIVYFPNALSNKNLKKDCILVFGAAVKPDKSASSILKDRVQSALYLSEKEGVNCLVLSGAKSVYGVHEAEVMKGLLDKFGRKENLNIIIDTKGLNTCASIRNLDKEKSYIFVSSDFHLARINLLAKKLGFKDYALHASKDSERYIKKPYFLFREALAFWYYLIFFDKDCNSPFRNLSIKADNTVNFFIKLFK